MTQSPVSSDAAASLVAKSRASTGAARLLNLQMLRITAAGLVLFFNLGGALVATGRLSFNLFDRGGIAVDIFFVLSGFVIAYSARPDAGTCYFLARRLARIGPLYWLLTTVLVAVALTAPSVLGSTVPTFDTVVRSYLFIPYGRDNGLIQPMLFIAWTLCYEMAFYVLFGLCLKAGRPAPWLACLALSTAAAMGRIWPDGTVLWRFYTNPVALEFGFGILLHSLYAHRSIGLRTGAVPSALAALAALALYRLEPGLPHVVQDGLVATFIVAAFLWLPPVTGVCAAVLVAFGDASYALYLSHPFVLQGVVKLLAPHPGIGPVALGAVALASALVTALFLHRFVDGPIRTVLIRRFGVCAPRRRSMGRAIEVSVPNPTEA